MSPVRRQTAISALGLLAAISVSACASHPKPMGPVATQAPPSQPAAPYAPPSAAPESAYVGQQSTSAAPGSIQDFVIHAGDRVYFDYNRYDVRADGRAMLDAQAAWLQRYPGVMVRIEGNTDDRGTREYNFALGARRAASVKDYLVAHGVAPGRVETVSYGKEHPIDLGNTEEDYAKNRNAHTDITSGAR